MDFLVNIRMSDEKQFSLDDMLFHVTAALNGLDLTQQQTTLQALGKSIKHNVAVSSHAVKDIFRKYGVDLELDICKRCGSDDVNDKMRKCPVCEKFTHLQCFLTEHKCCRRCVKPV